MYNNLLSDNNKDTKVKKQNVYHLTYERKSTDTGLTRWIDDNDKQRGFHLNDGEIKVLHNCTLMIIVDGIKQKRGNAELTLEKNNKIVRSYSEKSKNKLNVLRLTYADTFKSNDIISIEFTNIQDVQVVIYGH